MCGRVIGGIRFYVLCRPPAFLWFSRVPSSFLFFVGVFRNEMSKLRSGRPDASMFNHIGVDAYGSKQPLPSIGQVVLKSERQVTVNVYDATVRRREEM